MLCRNFSAFIDKVREQTRESSHSSYHRHTHTLQSLPIHHGVLLFHDCASIVLGAK